VTSPLSLHMLLSLLLNGAGGSTLNELRIALHHGDTVSSNDDGFKALISSLNVRSRAETETTTHNLSIDRWIRQKTECVLEPRKCRFAYSERNLHTGWIPIDDRFLIDMRKYLSIVDLERGFRRQCRRSEVYQFMGPRKNEQQDIRYNFCRYTVHLISYYLLPSVTTSLLIL